MPFNLSRKTKVYTSVVTVGMIAVLILNPFHTVQSGYVGVLTDFGSVQDAPLEPGLHFAMPFYQRILSVSTQPQTNTSDETAATHDLQNVHTSVSVTFHIPHSTFHIPHSTLHRHLRPGFIVISVILARSVLASLFQQFLMMLRQ